jgi:hypothetical protein
MSTEDEISNVENAKISDITSTAGEHNVDKELTVEKDDKQNDDDEIKNETNKPEIDQIEDKTEDVPITINQKIQEVVESNSEKPNEELTVV